MAKLENDVRLLVHFAKKVSETTIEQQNKPEIQSLTDKWPLQLRDDTVSDGDQQETILKNSISSLGPYIVVPKRKI